MSAARPPRDGDLPGRGLLIGGSAGGRMGMRPLGGLSAELALRFPVRETTSILIWDRDVRFLVDLGTGLSNVLPAERILAERDPVSPTFVGLTHYHVDHWCGLRWSGLYERGDLAWRCFSPRFESGFSAEADREGRAPLARLFARLEHESFWPTPLFAPGAELGHEVFEPGDRLIVDPWRVETFLLPHPGGCVGYKLSMPDGPTIGVATDCELAEGDWSEFLDALDVLIIDVQYSDEEYDGAAPLGDKTCSRVGWGHNCPRIVADALEALHVLPRFILLTHHDPHRTMRDLRMDDLASELLATLLDRELVDENRISDVQSACDGDLWALTRRGLARGGPTRFPPPPEGEGVS